jgi:hypothetical protein
MPTLLPRWARPRLHVVSFCIVHASGSVRNALAFEVNGETDRRLFGSDNRADRRRVYVCEGRPGNHTAETVLPGWAGDGSTSVIDPPTMANPAERTVDRSSIELFSHRNRPPAGAKNIGYNAATDPGMRLCIAKQARVRLPTNPAAKWIERAGW